MSFIVLTNSTRVILPMRTRLESPDRLPVLRGILVSQAKASGHCQQSFIEMPAPADANAQAAAGQAPDGQRPIGHGPGLPRPFRGDRWCYEWRIDGDNLLACWLGFPNLFFSSSIDPNLRVAVEALGHFGPGSGAARSLSRIHITVKVGGESVPRSEGFSWMPEGSPKVYPEG
jgi:hypothetical protein